MHTGQVVLKGVRCAEICCDVVHIYPSMNECVECGAENLGAAAWVGVVRYALDGVLVLVAPPQPF